MIQTENSIQLRGIWRSKTAGESWQQCDLTANEKETTLIVMQPHNLVRMTRARTSSTFTQEAGVSTLQSPPSVPLAMSIRK